MNIHEFESRDDASLILASILSFSINPAFDEKEEPRANIMVSGGSTPKQCYKFLSETDYNSPEPIENWSCIGVTLTDERCVPVTDKDSNEKMLRDTLLQGKANAASFMPLNDATLSDLLNQEFTHALLGMGEDGHFASIFPDTVKDSNMKKQLLDEDAEPAFIRITTEASEHERITANLSLLLKAQAVTVLAFGEKKRALLENPGGLPIASLVQNDKVHFFWAP